MYRTKLLVAMVALTVTMATPAIAQAAESGWYYYPDQGGWWYYWAETGEWQQDPGTQSAAPAGSVCDTIGKGKVVLNGYQIC